MTDGRTVQKYARFYMAGFDISGYTRSIGNLAWKFDEADLTTIADPAKGFLPGLANISPAGIDANFDTTATVGLHAVAKLPGVSRVCMIPIGIQNEPSLGSPAYCGRYQQSEYLAAENGGAMTVGIKFEGWDAAYPIGYDIPWGVTLLQYTQIFGENTAGGGFNVPANTAFGGYMVYQIFGGDGTARFFVDHGDTLDGFGNAIFAEMTGSTTTVLNCATPQAGIIALPKDFTVKKYIRWQTEFTSASYVFLAMAFVRANH